MSTVNDEQKRVYMEEHRTRSINYYADSTEVKIYQMHGLSLYCKAQFLNQMLYCLTDCGAGVNLLKKSVLQRILRTVGPHVTDKITLHRDRLVVTVANNTR